MSEVFGNDAELIEAVLSCVDPAVDCLVGNDEIAKAREVFAGLLATRGERTASATSASSAIGAAVRIRSTRPPSASTKT